MNSNKQKKTSNSDEGRARSRCPLFAEKLTVDLVMAVSLLLSRSITRKMSFFFLIEISHRIHRMPPA